MYKKIALTIFLLGLFYFLSATIHDSNIESSQTWTAAANPHIITASITIVDEVTVTIEPGCIIKLNPGISLSTIGKIVANGTSENHISITRNGDSGTYSTIYLTSNSTDNSFSYCDFSYGHKALNLGDASTTISQCTFTNCYYGFYANNGSFSLGNCEFYDNDYGTEIHSLTAPQIGSNCIFSNNQTAVKFYQCTNPVILSGNTFDANTCGLFFDQCSSPTINSGNLITDNTDVGIHFLNCSSLGIIDNITLTGNLGNGAFAIQNSGDFTLGSSLTNSANSWPLSIDPGSFPNAMSNIPATGNTDNNIQVISGSCNKTGTWHKFTDLDYYVNGTPTINATGFLTIEPGNSLYFNTGKTISIIGSLDAQGTVTDSINFLSQDDRTVWTGLYIFNEGSGVCTYSKFSQANKAININSATGVTISYCEFFDNAYGIYSNNTTALVISANNFHHNSTDAIYIRSTTGVSVNSSNNFAENSDGIVFYQCTNPVILSGNTLNSNIRGLFFDQCSSPTINSGNLITDNTDVGIHFLNCSDLGTIDNITLTGNLGNGAFAIQNSGDFTLGSSLTNSANSWPLSIDPGSFPNAMSNIPATGNTDNNIQVISGSCNKTGTWHKFTDLDYYVNGTPTINATGFLTIEPGNSLYFNTGKTISIIGSLDAQGTITDSINFLSQDDRTVWTGLYIFNEGSGVCTYSKFSQANKAININSATGVTISYCEFFDNAYGIYSNNTTALVISANNFHHNSTDAIYIRSTTGVSVNSSNNFAENSDGIVFYQCTNPVILSGNTLNSNIRGLFFDQCSSPTINSGNLITDNTDVGIHFLNCSDLGTIDNITLTGNLGNGAFAIQNSGDFTLGSSLTNSANSWPLSIDPGSFPNAMSNIPATGNTNNNIQVISGSCNKTGTWHKFTDLDYYVNGTPTINATGSLTIEPGNSLYFDTSKSINVSGVLDANGTVTDSINFLSQDSRAVWIGLYIYSGGSGQFSHCRLNNASKAININSATEVTISYCEFFDNFYAIYLNSENTTIQHSEIYNNSSTGITCNNSSPNIYNNSIHDNVQYGIKLINVSTPDLGSSVSQGNSIYNNGDYGIYNGTEDIDGNYIWWGTDNFHLIPAMIYDSEDDALLGTVSYSGWSDPNHEHFRTPATSPVNLVISEDSSQINLSWDSSIDGTYYQIYYSDEPYIDKTLWQLLTTEIFNLFWSEPSIQEKRFYYICAIEEL